MIAVLWVIAVAWEPWLWGATYSLMVHRRKVDASRWRIAMLDANSRPEGFTTIFPTKRPLCLLATNLALFTRLPDQDVFELPEIL